MHFTEEAAAQLKTWIVKRIENTSDADSDVLADYVIALLKHDGDQAAVRKLCEEEIPDFLTEDSKAFLDDVFQAITFKSYVPGAPPAPKLTSTTETNTAVILPPKPPSINRKRGFEDSADFQAQDEYQQSERAFKQPRRGGWTNTGGFNDYMPPGTSMLNLPYYDPSAQFDPNNPMEAFMRMQAMGMSFPAMPDYSGNVSVQRHRKRARCRDFDNKGFCSRGSSCAYDHGQESAYTDQADYDIRGDSPLAASQMIVNGPPFFHDSPRGARGGRGGRGGRKNRSGKATKVSRAAFSADGPVNDRSKTTIVVENIPEESFSEAQVSNFFTQFGNIQEVSMQPYKHLAIVKYDSWEAANAAYRSPKVIFDNRFVKVFWYKDDTEIQGGKDSKARENGFSESSKRLNATPTDETDPEDFRKRQEEAQRLHQERESKRSELEVKRQELEKQQHALLAKHRVETEKLQAKLLAKSGTGEDNDNGTADGNGTSAGSTGMLRARLALLEQEAKILGIKPENPNAEDDGSIDGSFQGSYRGRGSRGRGAYSRGGYVPRSRGSFRGNGMRHAAYAQYSIDNRPKKVAITGADFTAPEKDEALRHFLLSNGEFESVDSGAEKTTVSFQDRKTAEKFYFSLQGKELPGISGNLGLSWVNTPLPPVATGTAPSAGLSPADKATVEGNGNGVSGHSTRDGGEESKQVANMRQDEPQREVNMDYEMPDEEIW